MKKGKLFVLCGMIASGKGTYCKNAAKAGQLIVNDDAIYNMFHADQYELYTKANKPMYKHLETQAIWMGLSLGHTIVFDRGLNISFEARKRPVSIAKSLDCQVEAIVFKKEDPSVHAQRRFSSDHRGMSLESWEDVAIAHNQRWDNPMHAEGFDVFHWPTWASIQEGVVFK